MGSHRASLPAMHSPLVSFRYSPEWQHLLSFTVGGGDGRAAGGGAEAGEDSSMAQHGEPIISSRIAPVSRPAFLGRLSIWLVGLAATSSRSLVFRFFAVVVVFFFFFFLPCLGLNLQFMCYVHISIDRFGFFCLPFRLVG